MGRLREVAAAVVGVLGCLAAIQAQEAAQLPSQPAASAAQEGPSITQEIDALKKDNEGLRERVKALEESSKQSVVAGAAAPPAAAAPAPQPSTTANRIDMGRGLSMLFKGDVRLRYEKLFNAFDLNDAVDDNWGSTRLRTRLGFDVNYKEWLGAYVQIMNEYRWGSDTKYVNNFEYEDIRIDNAFLRLKHPWGLPLVFTGGRQDLLAEPEKGWRGMYGEGWLLFEGTPQDGSASISFDALKLRYDGLPDTFIDLIFADQASRKTATGASIASLYSSEDYDEELVSLYGSTKALKPFHVPLQLDLYFMYRNKGISSNYNTASSPFIDPERDTEVFGGRVASANSIFDKHFDFALEGAYETGSLTPKNGALGDTGATYIGQTPYPAGDDVRLDAYGLYAWGKVNFNQELEAVNPYITARFDFMSGDNPDTTGVYEGWDCMFAEYPKYSELLIYQYYDPFMSAHGTSDPNLGVWTNMYFPTLEVGFNPAFPEIKSLDKKMTFSLKWRYMMADQDNGPGGGTNIGNLYMFYVEYVPEPFLRTHFYFDYFVPGDYYTATADDSWFARVEMMFLF